MTTALQTTKALPGMGAVTSNERPGVTFRVWAPHAESVHICGDFNDWCPDADPLEHEADGYWAVHVDEARAGHEYKFRIKNGEQDFYRNDPYARLLTHSDGNSIVYQSDFDWQNDHQFQPPPVNEWVIYELHIGTFHRKSPDELGTFASAQEKLPYLRDIGINAIEIMPSAEFPGGISWGYNTAHPFAVERDYGGPDALKAFVKAAHEHGISVILDVVYNHFGPSDIDLWRFDGWDEGGGGIYFYNDWRSNTPWGDTRPDYGRQEVRQYIRDNALMWLEEYHFDGLRMDAISHVRNVDGDQCPPECEIPEGWSLMQWINHDIQQLDKPKVIIAEDLKNNEWIVKHQSVGGAGYTSQWDAGFVQAARDIMSESEDGNRDLHGLAEVLTGRYDGDAFKRVVYVESHDEVANGQKRITEEVMPGEADSVLSKERSLLASTLVMTAPGVPMLFQGQEFLEDQWFDDNEALDWQKPQDFDYILNGHRDLIWLRRNAENNTAGLSGQHIHLHHINTEGNVLAYHRWKDGGPGDSVIVLLNLSSNAYTDYRIGFPDAGLWRNRYNSGWQGYGNINEAPKTYDTEAETHPYDGMPYSGLINVKPYSGLIYSQ